VPSPEIPPEPAQPAHSIPFWQILGLLGLFLAIASASVVDPRPAALDRLRESIKLFRLTLIPLHETFQKSAFWLQIC